MEVKAALNYVLLQVDDLIEAIKARDEMEKPNKMREESKMKMNRLYLKSGIDNIQETSGSMEETSNRDRRNQEEESPLIREHVLIAQRSVPLAATPG